MPELPKVSQEFDANTEPYIRSLEAAVAWAENFAKANDKALKSVNALNAALRALPDTVDVTVRITYQTIGKPEEIAAATQVIKQVVIPASTVVRPEVQPVIEQVVGERGGGPLVTPMLPTSGDVAGLRAATAALRDEANALKVLSPALATAAGDANLLRDANSAVSFQSSEAGAAMMDEAAAINRLIDDATAMRGVWSDVAINSQRVSQGMLDVANNAIALRNATTSLNVDMDGLDNMLAILDGRARTSGAAIADMANQLGVMQTKLQIVNGDLFSTGLVRYTAATLSSKLAMEQMDADLQKTSTDWIANEQAILRAQKANEDAGNALAYATGAMIGLTAAESKAVGNGDFYRIAMAAAAIATHQLAYEGDALGPVLDLMANHFAHIAAVTTTVTTFFSRFHLAADAVLEAVIAMTGAALAFAAGLLAMAPAAQDVANHLKAVQTVSESLHSTIPPLNGFFEQLQHAMAPQVIALYGGALNLVGRQLGPLGEAARTVGGMFTTWMAKTDLWVNSQAQFGRVLQNGVGYLHQFAGILGNVFIAIDNLLKASPGTAHALLDIVGAGAQALKVFTQLPAPLLTFILALHSIAIWGPAVLNFLLGIGIAVTRLVLVFGLIASNPLSWLAGAVIALGLFAYESTQASKGAKDFINSLEQGLQGLTVSQSLNQITVDIGQLDQKIQQTTVSSELKNWDSSWKAFGYDAQQTGKDIVNVFKAVPQALSSWHNLGSLFGDIGRTLKDAFVPGGGAAIAAANDIKAFQNEIDKLLGKNKALFESLGYLIGQGHSFNQALALMDLAGVTASDTFAVMKQKIDNLITGYQNMGVQGGILSNSVNAVTFQTEQQNSKISQLTQAWTNFISMITGGASAFNTFATQMAGVAAAAGGAVDTLSVNSGRASIRITGLATAANDAKAHIGGLGANSIQLSQAFTQNITDGSNLINNLTTLSSAAGLGANGFHLLQQAGKDIVAQMLPFAKGSELATTELYALAQQAGYTGVNSFQALAKWVGNTKNPMQDLQTIVSTLTTKAGNLATDVQNLAAAISTNLNTAMAQAVAAATGVVPAMQAFATAVLKTHTSMSGLQPLALNLAQALYTTLGGNLNQTKTEFLAFAQGALRMTSDNANLLWQEVSGKLAPVMAQIGLDVEVSKNKFIDFAENGLDFTKGKASNLWANFSAAGNTWKALMDSASPDAKDKFIDFAKNGLNMTQTQAQNLWNNMSTTSKTAWEAIATDTNNAKNNFNTFARQGLNFTQTQAQDLWNNIIKNGDAAWLAAQGGTKNTQQAFITFARQGLNLTQQQAQNLWNNMGTAGRQAFANMMRDLASTGASADTLKNAHLAPLAGFIKDFPKTLLVTIKETGTGSFSISQASSALASGTQRQLPGPRAQQGMLIPGFGGGDIFPALLEPGEAVVPKHLVRAIAPFLAAHRVPWFASGGLVDSFSTNDAAKFVPWDKQELLKQQNFFTQAMEAAMSSAMKSAMSQTVSGISTPGRGGAGYSAFIAAAIQAIKLTGVPMSWLPDLSLIALYESGYNPNAINLTDSNAARGDPSRGYMQTIMSTFLANHVAGTSYNIYDPVANIAAAIEYILRTYGSVFNVPGVVSINRGGGYVGYDNGGLLMPGLTMAVNNTGRPEMVVPGGAGGSLVIGEGTININLDGQSIWRNQQQYTLKYNMRNRGQITGGVSNLNK